MCLVEKIKKRWIKRNLDEYNRDTSKLNYHIYNNLTLEYIYIYI